MARSAFAGLAAAEDCDAPRNLLGGYAIDDSLSDFAAAACGAVAVLLAPYSDYPKDWA